MADRGAQFEWEVRKKRQSKEVDLILFDVDLRQLRAVRPWRRCG
jgi:hypothetical protein